MPTDQSLVSRYGSGRYASERLDIGTESADRGKIDGTGEEGELPGYPTCLEEACSSSGGRASACTVQYTITTRWCY